MSPCTNTLFSVLEEFGSPFLARGRLLKSTPGLCDIKKNRRA